jgi:hypothetical protein
VFLDSRLRGSDDWLMEALRSSHGPLFFAE